MSDAGAFGLTGKVALVAGGGAEGDGIGNGRAAAILLARAGAKVAVADRMLDRAETTARMIREEGGEADAFEVDATQEAACQGLVDAIVARFGGLDLLDNNIGIGSSGSVVDTDLSDWQRVMRINVDAMMLLSKCAIPAMRDRDGGAIVNISSISALRPRGLTAYSVSKGAVIALTKAMAVDHGSEGIRVNCVAPGPVFTPMVGGEAMPPDLRDNRRKSSLLGIEGLGWDVGKAVRFLLSDEARYITGQTLVVDGGVTLRGPPRESRA